MKIPPIKHILQKNCAINEQTGDGHVVGRCFFYVGDDDQCPRHGDVSLVMDHYRETGHLTLENFAKPRPCSNCHGTGVIETGNNDLACKCEAGDRAIFNVAGHGQMTGAEMKKRGL